MTSPAVASGPRARIWTLRRRLGRAFVAVAALFVLLVAAVTVSAVLFTRAGNQVVYRWQPAISLSNRLLADLVSQETGIRGYALSRDRRFLQPYREFVVAQQKDERQLRSLVGDGGVVGDRLAALLRAADRWRATVAAPALAAIADNDPSGIGIVESSRSKDRFDEIRAASDELADELAARTRSARSARSVTGTVFAVAGGLSVLIVVACGAVLWQGLHRWVLEPVDRLGTQVRAVASGERNRRIVPDGPRELTGLGRDVEAMRRQIETELERVEQIRDELEQRTEELARSNEDLQQFAYVASHDLSEPLRKVANFCQLLERQYGPQLDDRARQYIDFAVDGAKRMQVLITDLLALSRVGRTTDRFVPVDLDAALDQAVANLGDKVTSADARIERSARLPTIAGDKSLLTSLLENLVGNAVKYRRAEASPVIEISVERGPGPAEWTLTVRDNGIGIDPQYADRIFVVFQRLHLRDEYGGTGIGLALCRKIVEFHGGRIWLAAVESPEPGATFRFTVPEGDRRAEPRDRSAA